VVLVGALLGACAGSQAAAPRAGEETIGRQAARDYEIQEATEASDTDELQVRLDHGFISQEAAQEAVMRHWSELRRCYDAAGPATAFAGGAVTLHFVVAPAGTIGALAVTESRLGNFEVERCLVGVGRQVTFPRPQGGADASVDYTLEFQSTGQIAVVDLADGQLDPNLPALLTHLGGRCEGLAGEEVLATLYVDATGAIRSNGLASASPLDPDAAACLSRALGQATVPAGLVASGTLGRLTVKLRSDLLARREPVNVARPSRRPSR
jgi:hypothetical protein